MASRRINVRGLIKKDGKLFAQKLKNKDGTSTSYWCTPGGGIDPQESLHDALKREMIEETGVAPKIGRLVLIQQFAYKGTTNHDETEQLEFFFEITNSDDYENIDISATTHGDLEIAECDFINPDEYNLLPTILAEPEFRSAMDDPTASVLFHTEL